MFISRLPLGASFTGGGTDVSDYYKTGYGIVESRAIKKYMYVIVNKRFDDDIRVGSSETEIVSSVDEIQHGIVREARLSGRDLC